MIKRSHKIKLKNMIASGADINAPDYDKRTPLHLAASEGKLNAVKFLIEHGVNPNPVDRYLVKI